MLTRTKTPRMTKRGTDASVARNRSSWEKYTGAWHKGIYVWNRLGGQYSIWVEGCAQAGLYTCNGLLQLFRADPDTKEIGDFIQGNCASPATLY